MLTRVSRWVAAAAVLSVLLGSRTGTAQTEGYDPLLQIAHQFAHPNVLILLDTTGSMAYDIPGTKTSLSNQEDTRGPGEVMTWAKARQVTTGCTSSQAKTWRYTLSISNDGPARMATLKNAMGNSVDLIDWSPPASWPTVGSLTAPTGQNLATDPITVWWDIASSSCGTATYGTTATGSPAWPFNPATAAPYHVTTPAQDLVGKTSSIVNWGLITFDTGNIHTWATVNPLDDGQAGVIATIESKLNFCGSAGVCAGSNTDTSEVLNTAKASLTTTWGTDLKRTGCGRLYSTILVTDGESNQCNPSANGWTNNNPPCKTTSWGQYPPGRTNELFLKGTDTTSQCKSNNTSPTNVLTFVIGVDPAVARCELNLDAYMGRTDASAANPIRWQNATGYTSRLPQNTTGATPLAQFDTTQDYAYFASDPTALRDAFASIISALAAGDYTTAAPVASTVTGVGTVSVIASTEFPSWKGHLYAFDRSKTPGMAGYVKWDAGWNLTKSVKPADDTAIPWTAGATSNPAYVAPSARKIYTWDPGNGNALVRVATDASTVTKLNSLCGSCGLTNVVANFILGYEPSISGSTLSTTVRPWVLGSSINGTPAITQAPEKFLQGTLEDHTSFEKSAQSPASRTPLVWIGADDGMLHAFQFSDGKEAFAILPPDLLAKQVTLASNYVSYTATKAPTGQPTLLKGHVYGVAGSPRFGDMFDGTAYKTVMLLTEGPGGKLIAGLDVTDPGKNIAAGTDPFSVLWSKLGGTDWTDLFYSWSTPAAGASSGFVAASSTHSVWKGVVGAGFNPASLASGQVAPKTVLFDPLTGGSATSVGPSAGTVSSPAPLVGNQTFADSTIYQMAADEFYADNIVDLALQPDLNGRIWFIPGPSFNTATVGIDASAKITNQGTSQQQPIYYSTAVNAYKTSSSTYDLYAFGSGTVYEISAQVTGSTVGQSGSFIPSLYLVSKPQNTTAATNAQIARIPIQDLYVPELDAAGACPAGSTKVTNVGNWTQTLCSGQTHVKVGLRTQLTASPNLFVPAYGAAGSPVALFLVYDPDLAGSCAGYSYIVVVTFNVSDSGSPTVVGTAVFGAGEGAASGFAVAGSSVIIAKSGVGTAERASVGSVPGVTLNPTKGANKPQPVWWRELK